MFIDGATERRKIERFPQRRLRAISLIHALLPVARRQRAWQATSDQGLDELIGSPVPKMRLTPTIAISPPLKQMGIMRHVVNWTTFDRSSRPKLRIFRKFPLVVATKSMIGPVRKDAP
jgi:hypothetical protein